jgi:hypothetical protein
VRFREILEDEIVEAAASATPAARFRAGKLNAAQPVFADFLIAGQKLVTARSD